MEIGELKAACRDLILERDEINKQSAALAQKAANIYEKAKGKYLALNGCSLEGSWEWVVSETCKGLKEEISNQVMETP